MPIAWRVRLAAVLFCLLSSSAFAAAPRTAFRCPMHPDVRSAAAGECPRCRMVLVAAPEVPGSYGVRVRLDGPAGIARPARLRFEVTDPGGQPVSRFLEVHERPFHAFVISQDLAFFAHLHPAAGDAGTLEAAVTLPSEGLYHVVSDFFPDGGTPQLVPRAVATRGATGDPAAGRARLGPLVAEAKDGTTRVSLRLPPSLVAGEVQAFRLTLRDASSGKPVDDLEPFLGAPAHLFVASEDLRDVAHSHPVMAFSRPTGPDVVFEVVFPRPGRYRVWAQFQRHGRPAVVSFDVPVVEAP